jgi:hypothetical protein
MPELAALQQAFGAALASVEAAPPATHIFTDAPERAIGRIAVYRGNVVGASTRALAGTYPVVAKIVGEEFFAGLAREYLRAHPSTSGDLNDFGVAFADFVAEFTHTRDLPYLPDVARMEWLAHRAYFAADARPLELAALGAVPEQDYGALRLALAPACALLESRWPLARLWEVHQDDYAGEFSVDLDAGPGRILVYRPRFRVQVAALSPGAHRFLQHVDAGVRLEAALDAALGAEPAFDLGTAISAWIGAGIVVGMNTTAGDLNS